VPKAKSEKYQTKLLEFGAASREFDRVRAADVTFIPRREETGQVAVLPRRKKE